MNRSLLYIISALLLLFFSVIALQVGSYFIPIGDVVSSVCHFFSKGQWSVTDKIVLSIRLPRIVLSVFAGSVLAVSGVVYQTLLRNPLAEPFTLGVSSGASFGVAIAVFLSSLLNVHLSNVPFAFVGGFLVLLLLFALALFRNFSLFTLIFVGIGISYFCNALLTLFLSLLGDKSYEILMWSFGTFSSSVSGVTFVVYIITSFILFGFLLYKCDKLDLFYLPDEVIATSGVNLQHQRILLLSAVSIMTIFTVSLCGVIGFVGLIVPHICRLIFGDHHRDLLIGSILIGGMLMLFSDTLARTVVTMTTNYGRELPVGVVTSIIGVPFFMIILLKKYHNHG